MYFKFFEGIDSHIDVLVYELKDTEDNSVQGLMRIAEETLISKELIDTDEVWIVVDTDIQGNSHRVQKLKDLRTVCIERKQWHVAQSNPCFEVWLYYHQENAKPNFDQMETAAAWKKFLGEIIKGGFNPQKHPILIETAVEHAETHFELMEHDFPTVASTELFRLAKSILAVDKVTARIKQLIQQMKQ